MQVRITGRQEKSGGQVERVSAGFKLCIAIFYCLCSAMVLIAVAEAKGNSPEGMALIPAGEFVMGKEGSSNKTPHTVYLDAFYMDKHEVTQEEFERVRGYNPSKFKGPDLPVDQSIWFEAKGYCQKVGKRLPTEAEWEKAARGGTSSLYYWGDEMDEEFAWYNDNAGDTTHAVGMKKPNSYGLYDMSGNVWEWTTDWYEKKYYETSPKNNPPGPTDGEEKVIRGGSWYSGKMHLSSATRYWSLPNERNSNFGFRCAADASGVKRTS